MLLSVIIPFYHVEAYIGACLSRVAQLPEAQCEVILVDDCGSDGSAAIAAAYCEAHANARVVRRAKNGGLSAARNTGFEEAVGDYVYYLDSDDLPEPDALMRMTTRAAAQNLDVIKGRFVSFDDETGEETPGPAIEATDVISGGALFARQCKMGVYEPMVWQCVYRRAFLQEIGLSMAEGLLFEDELFQAPALFEAKRVQATEDCVLRYRQRAGSIMKSFSKSAKWCESYLAVCRRLHALAKAHEKGEAVRALKKRVGQIAVSVAKNIAAYGLTGNVRKEAISFVYAHRSELAGFALYSGDAVLAVQGLLLRCSVRVFLAIYGGLRRN